MAKRSKKKPSPAVNEPNDVPPEKQMSREYRELLSSPFFQGWSSEDYLFAEWGRWKGERPRESRKVHE